ncbi:MAG: glycosyltransferase family 4 protein [Clostridiales bacterium]|jgi:glycosyltransferase involved in cell wall biosynthesis|nr:glycosyltransferase family 4 protein [Clostridiales bacterium]
MRKLGFITPWYGENIPGGAEAALRDLVKHLHMAGISLEVLTTCVKQFNADWNTNFYRSGLTKENGITIRRFPVRKRDTKAFNAVNYKLIKGLIVTDEDEGTFVREMINSPNLYNWLDKKSHEYALFVFIPYMFGTTYYGLQVAPRKSVLIPCFHDESYLKMDIFKKLFSTIKGMIFNSYPEKLLAEHVYNLANVDKTIIGIGTDTHIIGNKCNFIKKYKISKPFILYAGRKDEGKNVSLLIKYFAKYKSYNKESNLYLVLIGGGKISIPSSVINDIFDLGFLSTQDKYDAYTSAKILCQPSINESFSLVIMESWLCYCPVLVHSDCSVTKYFTKAANGGLYFSTYMEFEACVNYILNNKDVAELMGEQGKHFVLENYAWEVIIKKYITYFNSLNGETL